MEQLETLKKKINSARDLQSVVSTMKALAAVHIREYERAVTSLEEYNRTVELGLHVVLQDRPQVLPIATSENRGKQGTFGAVIFGSEQGMCGQFNSVIVEFALKQMETLGIQPEQRQVLALGQRVIPELNQKGQTIDEQLAFVVSSEGIGALIQRLLSHIEYWRNHQHIDQIVLFHNTPTSGSNYQPTMLHVLPLDLEWLRALSRKSWQSRSLPLYTMPWEQLFTSLIRQYFFASLWRAVVESLASENASRLSAMQAAERSIEERLNELNNQFQRQRQNAITSELLDVVSGFEALTGKAH